MARLPPLLPTPPASLRDTDADESRAPKRHRHLESPPRTEASGSRHHRGPSPPPSSRRRAERLSPSPPPKGRRRARSPPYVSTTQRPKRPSADAAVDGRGGGDMAGPPPLDEALLENRPSRSHCNRKHSETSSAAAEKRPDPAIPGDQQELHSEKMEGQNQSNHKAPSRNARRKRMRRQVWKEAKNQMREMKKDKLSEKIKKLQDCVRLLEKEGADMAEIRKFRNLLESTKKQYAENEAQLAMEGSSASQQVLNTDRLERTHVEKVPASVEKVERDEQNMDYGEAEGITLKGCKAVPDENELAEEVNRLRSEIEAVKQDRDYQSAQARSLMADMAKQKEVARMYGAELEDAMRRVAALEEQGLLQRETIQTLQIQLASANEKLT
ncbi:unnamed protein product [Alopecurus aequalis]